VRHQNQAKRIAHSIKASAHDRAVAQASATFKTRKAQENNIPKIVASRLEQVAASMPDTRKGKLIRAYLGF